MCERVEPAHLIVLGRTQHLPGLGFTRCACAHAKHVTWTNVRSSSSGSSATHARTLWLVFGQRYRTGAMQFPLWSLACVLEGYPVHSLAKASNQTASSPPRLRQTTTLGV